MTGIAYRDGPLGADRMAYSNGVKGGGKTMNIQDIDRAVNLRDQLISLDVFLAGLLGDHDRNGDRHPEREWRGYVNLQFGSYKCEVTADNGPREHLINLLVGQRTVLVSALKECGIELP